MNAYTKTPEDFLSEVLEEEKREKVGQLKIFFGFAAGVGKTYAMLEAAHLAKEKGVDVVIGYIEPHARPQTTALLQGLEILPPLDINYNGITLKEFNLDATLARHPTLVLVDELAHTNAKGCRHVKRYQDVQELLQHGIDVYTTINVQHIESLNDLVAAISGIAVRERIPDAIFDDANQVELIDIEPQDLLERLKNGHVYSSRQAQRALANFFTVDNLTALREIALRRCADRMQQRSKQKSHKQKGGASTKEHILVCLSSAPSNATIIRTAARMAKAFQSTFTALFVETPEAVALAPDDKQRLQKNITLAHQLGAQVETVSGDDVPAQIANFATIFGVTTIVIGRSAAKRPFFYSATLTERLIAAAPHLDIHIIPDVARANSPYRRRILKHYHKKHHHSSRDAIKSIVILAIASAIGHLFDRLGFTESNIITIYILSVLLIAISTDRKRYSLIASVICVLAFNFFFTEPRYSLQAYDSGYPITFLIMFLAALLTSSLAMRLKDTAKQAAEKAFKTRILLDTNQLLRRETNDEGIAALIAKQLTKLLNREIIICLAEGHRLLEPQIYTAQGVLTDRLLSSKEKGVAMWVFQNNHHAGATTDTLANASNLYLAIRTHERVLGVVGIAIPREPLSSFERGLVLAIIGECALAMQHRSPLVTAES